MNTEQALRDVLRIIADYDGCQVITSKEAHEMANIARCALNDNTPPHAWVCPNEHCPDRTKTHVSGEGDSMGYTSLEVQCNSCGCYEKCNSRLPGWRDFLSRWGVADKGK